MADASPAPPPATAEPAGTADDRPPPEVNLLHGHRDLVQAVAFNTYGDRCATGSVDGKMRVFSRHRDGTWRLCDIWSAHAGEVLELLWLPASIYPSLIASLGLEGWFRLWAEDPSAPPGRRFSSGRSVGPGPAFDTRSSRAPYRSFSIKHDPDSRHTYLALLATDGRLTVYENEQAENVSEYSAIDEFTVCPKPSRGEELSFRLRFDPNPEPCYAAIRAGLAPDALGLLVAAMTSVKLYRSRDVTTTSYGLSHVQKEFYLALELPLHHGLVRDLAWAPGNIRGYDLVASACQDGYARVFRIDTPCPDPDSEARSWSPAELLKPTAASPSRRPRSIAPEDESDGRAAQQQTSGLSAGLARPALASASPGPDHPSSDPGSGPSASHQDRGWSGLAGQVRHTFREISRLDNHRIPVWRIGFDDDGQILATTGDDGRLLCYRQTPDGLWAKSSELAMMKTSSTVP